MTHLKEVKVKYDNMLHMLYHLIKAEWYSCPEDISDDYDEWLEDYVADAEQSYRFDYPLKDSPKPTFIEYMYENIQEGINHYYLIFGTRLLKKGARVVNEFKK